MVGNAQTMSLNPLISSQNITLTEANSSINLLSDGARFDTTKNYSLTYVVDIASDTTIIDGEDYVMQMPNIFTFSIQGDSSIYVDTESGKKSIGKMKNTEGKLTIRFNLGEEETPHQGIHIPLTDVRIVPPAGYSGEEIQLNFSYGDGLADSYSVTLAGKPQLSGLSVENSYSTFDGNAHTITITESGDATGCTLSYADENDEFTLSEKPTFIEAGNYTIKVKASKEGYTDTLFSGIVNIDKKQATISADSITTHVGDSIKPLTYQIEGEVSGYPITDIQVTRIGEAKTPGTYVIDVQVDTIGKNTNYNITTANSTYTITPHAYDSSYIEESLPTCTEDGFHHIDYKCTICGHTYSSESIADARLGHIEPADYTIDVPATCTSEGSMSKRCTRCNDTISTQIIPKAPHTWGRDTTMIEAPTCEADGKNSIKCLYCDTTKIDPIIALGHDFAPTFTIDVEPTCSEEGSQSRHCTRIGCEAKTDIESIGMKPHTWGRDTTTILEPTCTEWGKDSITCLYCTAFKIERIDTLGHDFEEGFTIDVAPRCTVDGSQSRHCTRCEATKEETSIPAIGHEFDTEYTIDVKPNCTTNGIKSRHCIHEGCTISIDTVVLESNGEHVWEIESVIVEATCTEPGEVNRICTKCGEKAFGVKIKELGHDYPDTFTVDVAATCIHDGEKSRHCTRCDSKIDHEVIPALGHTWDNGEVIVAPTCTTTGTTQYTCVRQDTTKIEVTPALGHDFSGEFIIDKKATCTEDGEKSRHCQHTGCDERSEITVIVSAGHNWGDTTLTIEPTCTKPGEKTIKCVVCNAEKKEPVDTLGHLFSDEFTTDVEATCENAGSKSKHCIHKNCTATIEVTTIEPLGHKMELDTIQIEPTCTKVGQAKYICSVCGVIDTREIAALGHEFADTFSIDRAPTCLNEGVQSKHCIHDGCLEKTEITPIPKGTHKLERFEVVKKATCTENGLEKFKCEVCGTIVDSTISRLGHDWENEYTIDVMPTCTKGGSKSKHCKRCDAKTGTTVIPSPGHLWGQVRWENIVEATCTENGSHDENIYCDRCGVLRDTESKHIIDYAKGHDYEGTEEYFIKPTCTESGIVLYTCKICQNIAKDTVKPMGHLYDVEYTVDVPATCLELGSESRHCTRTGCDAKFDKREIAPLGHLWNESDTITVPTCTQGGLISKSCERCQAKEDKHLEALGHAFADTFTVDVPPTCHSEGSKSRHCIRCEERKDTVTMPAVDHQPGEPIKENHQPATCLEPGTYTEVIVCKFCGLELSRKQGVAEEPTGHQWNEGVDVVAPTCTEGGIKTFTCTVCGFVETKNVEALGHAFADTFTIDIPMTCLTDGLQSKHCVRCDAHTLETVIPAMGHDSTDVRTENNIEPTCTTEGSYDVATYCKICKVELNREHVTLDSLGHQWNAGITTIEPTCTGKGVISHTCKICKIVETKEISSLGHQYSDSLIVDEQVTCTSNGKRSRHCIRCDSKTDIEIIPFKGHIEGTPVKENEVAATCTVGGSYEDVIYCTTCHSEMSRSKKTTEAKGHTWNAGETTIAATCTTPGVATFTCTVCTETTEKTIAALGHTFADTLTVDVPVGCTTNGISSHHCIRCDVTKDTVITPAHGHEFDNGVITRAATDTTEGVKTYSCKFCDTKNEVALKMIVSLVKLDNGQFFAVNTEGYCQGEDGQIGYTIKGGMPIDFKLTFSDSAKAQGFADKSWTEAPADHQIVVQIPAGCAQGKYEADVVFRNEDTVETKPIKLFINVNFSQEMTVAIYRDVVSIIKDESKQYGSFQWFHNGEKIEGATLPYYQEQGGLSGTYYVVINEGTDQEMRTCARDNWYNPLNKYRDISVMPNPIRSGTTATIKLYNFADTEHTLTVDNEFGTTIYGPATFEGDELSIPADNFGLVSGLFIINIDGVKVKVLKQ